MQRLYPEVRDWVVNVLLPHHTNLVGNDNKRNDVDEQKDASEIHPMWNVVLNIVNSAIADPTKVSPRDFDKFRKQKMLPIYLR